MWWFCENRVQSHWESTPLFKQQQRKKLNCMKKKKKQNQPTTAQVRPICMIYEAEKMPALYESFVVLVLSMVCMLFANFWSRKSYCSVFASFPRLIFFALSHLVPEQTWNAAHFFSTAFDCWHFRFLTLGFIHMRICVVAFTRLQTYDLCKTFAGFSFCYQVHGLHRLFSDIFFRTRGKDAERINCGLISGYRN